MFVFAEQMQRQESNCSCAVPCSRVSYEPALSYAQLSKFSVERLVLQDPVRRGLVEEQYKLAREDFQRVDSTTSQADIIALETIQDETAELATQLEIAVQTLSDGSIESWINDLGEALEADRYYMDEDLDDEIDEQVSSIINDLWRYRYSLPELMNFAATVKDNLDDYPTFETYVIECVYIGSVQDSFGSSEEPPPNFDFPFGATTTEKQVFVRTRCPELVSRLDSVLDLSDAYTSGIEELYANTTSSPADIPEHIACEVQLAKITDPDFVSNVETLATLLRDIFLLPNRADLLILGEQIADLMNETAMSDLANIYTKVGDECGWLDDAKPDMEDISGILGPAVNELSGVPYTQFEDTIYQMQELLSSNLNASLSAVNQYLAGTITKLEMAEIFQLFVQTTALDDLKTAQITLATKTSKIAEKLQSVSRTLESFYEDLFSMEIPPLNNGRIANLEILPFALGMGVQRIDELYANLTSNPLLYFPAIAVEILDNIQQPLEEIENTIREASLQATDAMTTYITKMEKYSTETTMDEEFFM